MRLRATGIGTYQIPHPPPEPGHAQQDPSQVPGIIQFPVVFGGGFVSVQSLRFVNGAVENQFTSTGACPSSSMTERVTLARTRNRASR